MSTPLPILYRDDAIIAINKPAGLLVHRSNIDRHETRFAVQLLRDQIGQKVYPVHRLDKPTSGVLLFALSSEMAKRLSAAFATKQVQKTYQAIVRGWPPSPAIIDYALVEQLDKMTDSQARQDKAAQPAVTHYQVLYKTELPHAVDRYPTSRYAWLKLQPETGRKHQIRRHMHHISHPIVGDTTHGNGKHNRFFRDHLNCNRLLLVASKLRIQHPVTAEPLVIAASAEEAFAQVSEVFKTQAI